jgi:uncharacterized protein (DUF1330 family)
MAYALVKLKVEDLTKWKTGFEAAGEMRKKFGSKGAQAFSLVDDPAWAVALVEFEDLEKGREMYQSQDFRDAAKRAGVTGAPEITFLTEVMELPA